MKKLNLPKRAKYNNQKTIVNGIIFSSKREAKRYWELELLKRAGEISDLELQCKLPVLINNKKVFTYVADFVYTEEGIKIIEDCKGFRTAVYKIKKKAIEAYYGITIKET